MVTPLKHIVASAALAVLVGAIWSRLNWGFWLAPNSVTGPALDVATILGAEVIDFAHQCTRPPDEQLPRSVDTWWVPITGASLGGYCSAVSCHLPASDDRSVDRPVPQGTDCVSHRCSIGLLQLLHHIDQPAGIRSQWTSKHLIPMTAQAVTFADSTGAQFILARVGLFRNHPQDCCGDTYACYQILLRLGDPCPEPARPASWILSGPPHEVATSLHYYDVSGIESATWQVVSAAAFLPCLVFTVLGALFYESSTRRRSSRIR